MIQNKVVVIFSPPIFLVYFVKRPVSSSETIKTSCVSHLSSELEVSQHVFLLPQTLRPAEAGQFEHHWKIYRSGETFNCPLLYRDFGL